MTHGVHFALDSPDEAKLLSLESDEERVGFVTEDIEERYFKTSFAVETDKAWDAIHRCFDGGELTEQPKSSLQMAVLGGRSLSADEYYIISYKSPDDVRSIDAALRAVDAEAMRALQDTIDPEVYGMSLDQEHWEYVWHWFEQMRAFYSNAAATGRAVIFTADQ